MDHCGVNPLRVSVYQYLSESDKLQTPNEQYVHVPKEHPGTATETQVPSQISGGSPGMTSTHTPSFQSAYQFPATVPVIALCFHGNHAWMTLVHKSKQLFA